MLAGGRFRGGGGGHAAAMSIRLDLAFPEPLDQDAATRLLLAAAALPEVRRAVLSPDRRRSTWYGAELPLARVRQALAEAGLSPGELRSSLPDDADAALAAPPGERFRPIGR